MVTAQQLVLEIEAAQLEVGNGEQTLQAEARVGEVGGGDLRAGRGGLDLAANGSQKSGSQEMFRGMRNSQ